MIDPSQDRHRWQTLVNAVMNLPVPQYAGNMTSRGPVSFSRTLIHMHVRRVTTFQSTTDRVYDGGPIRL